MDFLNISHPKLLPESKLFNKRFPQKTDKKIVPIVNISPLKVTADDLAVPFLIKSDNSRYFDEKSIRMKSQGAISLNSRIMKSEPKIAYKVYSIPLAHVLKRENTSKPTQPISRKKNRSKISYDLTENSIDEHKFINVFKKEFTNRPSTNQSPMKNIKPFEKSFKPIRNNAIRLPTRSQHNLDQISITAWEV